MQLTSCEKADWTGPLDRPEDAEPKYTNSLAPNGDKYDKFKHLLSAHHNETYNMIDKTLGSKHWFLRYMEKMSPNAIKYTDFLQRKRLQTLFSVDDSVEKVKESSWEKKLKLN